MMCARHPKQPDPCVFCELEGRLPNLNGTQLPAMARYIEELPDRLALSGELQGLCLDLAGQIRQLDILLKAA